LRRFKAGSDGGWPVQRHHDDAQALGAGSGGALGVYLCVCTYLVLTYLPHLHQFSEAKYIFHKTFLSATFTQPTAYKLQLHHVHK
jgi:hypothetical protein